MLNVCLAMIQCPCVFVSFKCVVVVASEAEIDLLYDLPMTRRVFQHEEMRALGFDGSNVCLAMIQCSVVFVVKEKAEGVSESRWKKEPREIMQGLCISTSLKLKASQCTNTNKHQHCAFVPLCFFIPSNWKYPVVYRPQHGDSKSAPVNAPPAWSCGRPQ